MRNNRSNETNEDYNFARCWNCKFPLNKSRDRTLKKANITYATLSPAPAESDAPKDHTINGGCPFCGCPQPY